MVSAFPAIPIRRNWSKTASPHRTSYRTSDRLRPVAPLAPAECEQLPVLLVYALFLPISIGRSAAHSGRKADAAAGSTPFPHFQIRRPLRNGSPIPPKKMGILQFSLESRLNDLQFE
jgi:hypothetical protein